MHHLKQMRCFMYRNSLGPPHPPPCHHVCAHTRRHEDLFGSSFFGILGRCQQQKKIRTSKNQIRQKICQKAVNCFSCILCWHPVKKCCPKMNNSETSNVSQHAVIFLGFDILGHCQIRNIKKSVKTQSKTSHVQEYMIRS